MKKKSLYPINLKLLSDRKSLVYEVFRKVAPHKGSFVGVCELEGCFMCDEPEMLFDSLKIGELLMLESDTENKTKSLSVKRTDGMFIGNIPFSDSLLPNLLISRGIKLFCYLEAKEFIGGMLALAVSVYCDNY